MIVQQEGKTVEIWLTQADQKSLEIQTQLAELYKDCKQKGQWVVVYRSGAKDLTEQTSTMLCHNRKRAAQTAVQQRENRSR